MRRPRPALPHAAPLAALLLAALLICAPCAGAQESDTTATANLQARAGDRVVVLTLVDGSKLQGRVLEVTPSSIRFASAIGETTIPRSAVREVHVVTEGELHGTEVWPEDPSRTRLFFSPTGRTLRKDEGYFADAYIFFPSFQFGVTDAFTLGAGISILPGVGLDEQVYYLTPKVSVYASPDVNISLGALVAGAAVISDASPFGIGYGVATFGGENTNLTTGAGFGFSRGNSSSAPLLLLGGSTRTSRNIALLSENYLLLGDNASGLFSGGIRFIGEKLSVDLAAFLSSEANGTPLPYVSFIYKF